MNFFEESVATPACCAGADQAARLANCLGEEAFGLKGYLACGLLKTRTQGLLPLNLQLVGQPTTAVAASPHLRTGALREEVHSGTNPLAVLVVGKRFVAAKLIRCAQSAAAPDALRMDMARSIHTRAAPVGSAPSARPDGG